MIGFQSSSEAILVFIDCSILNIFRVSHKGGEGGTGIPLPEI